MYKVLIVDDHELVCDSLEKTLNDSGEFTVTGKLPSADLTELFCEKNKPDLVFMDICTEDGASGLNAIKILKVEFPEIKVIGMSVFDEISYAPRALKIGAHAFVAKRKSLDYFIEVARGVMQGKIYNPGEKTIPLPNGKSPLSHREMEILRLMCKHMTSGEIAEELFISENTVKYHKKHMLAKTGFTKLIDLTFHVITHGWINPLY